ncbi:MAG: hydrogenase maturation protease [Anaerolineae bacterium]
MGSGEGQRAAAGRTVVPGRATPGSVPETLILGLGNPLRGDDGVGVRLAQMLAGRRLPAGVEVVDGGTQGLGLVSLLEGRRRAIVIDAAEMGRRPGEFVRFMADEVHLSDMQGAGFSVHEAGLREALLLARALGLLPDEVVVYGVQPARVEWDAGLSPQVEAALPALAEAVMDEVTAAN